MENRVRKPICARQIYRAMICWFMLTMTAPATLLWAAGGDLYELSLEDLMSVEVTSVSGKGQSLSDSAAAIFVITNEDLKQSGVTNIPDALRMVPGLNVSRIDANKWAVNSRGPNSRFANKLLVLVDGRSVYSNTFSGVYWEVQDVLLEDVERIEVIRGPGATLWGANAVNGVINIITKHAADTQGGFVELGAGTEEQGFAGARYGLALGEVTYGRVYAKAFKRDEFKHLDGDDAGDDWKMIRTGFRLDSSLSTENTLTLQGDLYQGEINQDLLLDSLAAPYLQEAADEEDVSGGNLIGRWHRIFSATSEITAQAYFDHIRLENIVLEEERHTVDLEFQHRWRAISHNDIIWGARYRNSHDDYINSYVVSIEPVSLDDELYSCFLQDEITLVDERLWFTLGSKLEHNDYTGYEFQPSARLLFAPADKHRVWAAVSRAVRTPSRVENGGRLVSFVQPPSALTMGLPLEVALQSDKNFDSEVLKAYELGYRFTAANKLSVDLAAFYHDYDKLRGVRVEQPVFQGTYLQQDLTFDNSASGRAYGAELATAYKATDWWQLDLAYTYLDCDIDYDGEAPIQQLSLRSAFKVGRDLDLDLWLRYVDAARATYLANATGYYEVDSYTTCDLRLAWRAADSLELSLVGQNLLEDRHLEFVQEKFTQPTEVPRGVYGKLAYRF